jgi:hypothetical protein
MDKHVFTKHYTENYRLSNMNLTNIREWTQVLRKGIQSESELRCSGKESSSGVNSCTPEGKTAREWTRVLRKGKQFGSELGYSWRESSPGVNSGTPEGKAVREWTHVLLKGKQSGSELMYSWRESSSSSTSAFFGYITLKLVIFVAK